MPILNNIQRRTVSGKIILTIFYSILIFGSVWMVYPFLLMVSGSFKSAVDARQMSLLPKFLFNEQELYRKFTEQRYGRIGHALAALRSTDKIGGRLYSFESIELPFQPPQQEIKDWTRFVESSRKTWPYFYEGMGHVYMVRGVSEIGYRYMQELRSAFPNMLSETSVNIPPEEWYSRNYLAPQEPASSVYWKIRKSLPKRYFYPLSIEGIYQLHALNPRNGAGTDAIKKLNQEWKTRYASLAEVELKPTFPENAAERLIWSDFVRNYLSSRYIIFSQSLLAEYRIFLQRKYAVISTLNKSYQTNYQNWQEIPLPGIDAADVKYHDADLFLHNLSDLSQIRIRSLDFEWRDFINTNYENDVQKLNEAWGTTYNSFGQIRMPIAWEDLQILRKNKPDILEDYLTRNYRFAWDQIVTHSNGLRNTVIFCLLNVLTALIINPLAAYALSRFQPRWGQAALFILMATMAFPAEVTQIPSFLLLRDLGWLNTFAALVIPTAANGFAIFLLKGFFDSLPTELYEAATLDGCGEFRCFFTIAIPLSGPILAVIALAAFTAAYGAFMFALLVCQKESMWTMMVYIYQLQQNYNSPVTFAALIIAAIPTLLIFILCQNVIMKGIVVPVEK